MVLKARIRPRSGFEPRFCHRPSELDRKSPETPFGFAITVERPPSVRSGLDGPPTRTGSLSPDSLANVLHSEVSSIEWDSSTSPHSEHTVSPAEWSNTTSVFFLQSVQNASAIDEIQEKIRFAWGRAGVFDRWENTRREDRKRSVSSLLSLTFSGKFIEGGNGQRVNAFIDKRELWVGVRKLTPVPFSCVACAFAQVDNHRVW